MMTLADRRHRDAADKTAGQCRGDIGLWVDWMWLSGMQQPAPTGDRRSRYRRLRHPHLLPPIRPWTLALNWPQTVMPNLLGEDAIAEAIPARL